MRYFLVAVCLGNGLHKSLCTDSVPASLMDKEPEVLRVAGDLSMRAVLGNFGARFADVRESAGQLVEVELDLTPGLNLRERAENNASSADVWVFMSPEPLQLLAQKNVVSADSARTLATDRLAVVTAWPVVRRGEPPPWPALAEKQWKRVAVANFRTSPSGVGGVRALKNAGVWDKLDYRVELRPDSDEVLMDVMTAKVDAGIIFRSESRRLTQKKSFTIYELNAADGEFVICAAVTAGSPRVALARQFVNYMASQQTVWKELGYEAANVKR